MFSQPRARRAGCGESHHEIQGCPDGWASFDLNVGEIYALVHLLDDVKGMNGKIAKQIVC